MYFCEFKQKNLHEVASTTGLMRPEKNKRLSFVDEEINNICNFNIHWYIKIKNVHKVYEKIIVNKSTSKH